MQYDYSKLEPWPTEGDPGLSPVEIGKGGSIVFEVQQPNGATHICEFADFNAGLDYIIEKLKLPLDYDGTTRV